MLIFATFLIVFRKFFGLKLVINIINEIYDLRQWRPLLHTRVGSEYEEGGSLVGVLWRWTRWYSSLSTQAFSGTSVASYPSVHTFAIPLHGSFSLERLKAGYRAYSSIETVFTYCVIRNPLRLYWKSRLV